MAWPPKLERKDIYIGMRLACRIGDGLFLRKVLDIKDNKFILSRIWEDRNDPKHNDDNNEIGSIEELETIQNMMAQDRADLPYAL